jgi:hypothetical protein
MGAPGEDSPTFQRMQCSSSTGTTAINDEVVKLAGVIT